VQIFLFACGEGLRSKRCDCFPAWPTWSIFVTEWEREKHTASSRNCLCCCLVRDGCRVFDFREAVCSVSSKIHTPVTIGVIFIILFRKELEDWLFLSTRPIVFIGCSPQTNYYCSALCAPFPLIIKNSTWTRPQKFYSWIWPETKTSWI